MLISKDARYESNYRAADALKAAVVAVAAVAEGLVIAILVTKVAVDIAAEVVDSITVKVAEAFPVMAVSDSKATEIMARMMMAVTIVATEAVILVAAKDASLAVAEAGDRDFLTPSVAEISTTAGMMTATNTTPVIDFAVGRRAFESE